MDQSNPKGTKNEERLYHGSSGDVIQNIVFQGFNRSYAGKNGEKFSYCFKCMLYFHIIIATAFGDGVYFAVNANYSAQDRYSRPDSNGNKYIFLALVLTGEYTQGQNGLKVPPPKNPNDSTLILFDSVVDNTNKPSMYVVFYDAQSYPEYLITFK